MRLLKIDSSFKFSITVVAGANFAEKPLQIYNNIKIINYQQKKGYCSMRFAAIDLKLLVMINNSASYDKRMFWSQAHNL